MSISKSSSPVKVEKNPNMRNFIIFFDEKEGTSPLVRLMDQVPGISVLHQTEDKGWEPFDTHSAGYMSVSNMEACFDIIFSRKNNDFDTLNEIYCRTSSRPLENVALEGAIGFKMRYNPHGLNLPFQKLTRRISRKSGIFNQRAYREMMLRVLKRHNIMVFIAVRQDVFRWALSKYHGDGSGKPGHLQFKLANGSIGKSDIGKISVDCGRFEKILNKCTAIHNSKKQLIEHFDANGIQNSPIRYESFVEDKGQVLTDICDYLSVHTPAETLEKVATQGSALKKVHSNDISEFVTNHEEILNKFGDRFVAWP